MEPNVVEIAATPLASCSRTLTPNKVNALPKLIDFLTVPSEIH